MSDVYRVETVAGLLRQARDVVTRYEDRLAGEVRAALRAGVSAADVADAAGISRARVYQIRDGRR
jgi:hypothetical protein